MNSQGGTPTILDLEGLIGPLELLRVSIRTAFPRAVAEDLAAKAAKEERDAAAAAAAHAERRTGGHGVHQGPFYWCTSCAYEHAVRVTGVCLCFFVVFSRNPAPPPLSPARALHDKLHGRE